MVMKRWARIGLNITTCSNNVAATKLTNMKFRNTVHQKLYSDVKRIRAFFPGLRNFMWKLPILAL